MSPPRGRQRRLALGVLLGAAGVALATFPLRHTWWGGWVLAIAEAGIVGGLADWFAVTAIFRRPLGLPIPHTALIPANWELMARRVGVMVGERVLSPEYLKREIERLDLAEVLALVARRLDAGDLADVARSVARWVAGQLGRAPTEPLVAWLQARLAATSLSPILATALEGARHHGWDRRVVAALARALADMLERPEVRTTTVALVDEVLAGYRQRAGAYPALFLGFADVLGLIDRERLAAALRTGLRRVAEDPAHPVRERLSALVAELPGRLRDDAALAGRVDAALAEALASPLAADVLRDAAGAIQRGLVTDLTGPESELAGWAAARLEGMRTRLAADHALRASVDRWLKAQAVAAVDHHHERIGALIERGVRALGPEGAVRLIEEHAGDDLQYIRVNGTLVGGLAGGALYGLHLLVRTLG